MTRLVQYVEIDMDYCALTYGTSPCTAAMPTTGSKKCFNTLNTCQDRANFDNDGHTYRFALDTDYLPASIDAIPSVTDVALTPSVISLGENLGLRSSLTITFKDHQWADAGAGFDKYTADRSYDPFSQGTFWGKWRSRHPFVRGRAIRLIRGFDTQELAAMETRHFIIDHFDGPDASGHYKLIAKDALKLADNSRSVAPVASNGSLNAAITDVATSATLTPSGIGNAEYPASGTVAIGGKEICTFTRSGDVLTLTRAQANTEAVAHAAEDRVQLCLVYTGEDAADIIDDLLTTYAGVDAAFVPTSSWQAETAAYLQRVYTTIITEPTGVDQLVSEIIEQAGLALWWDEVSQTIKLQVLREIPITAANWSEENVNAGSFGTQEQRNKRISQVRTYYGQRNPLRPLRELDNYRSQQIKVDAQNQADYGSPEIKTILSRWIPAFGGTTADRLNDILLARFASPPRKLHFDVFKDGVIEPPTLGQGINADWWCYQTDEGVRDPIPAQVVSLETLAGKVRVTAEEMRFTGIELDDPNDRVIIIDTDSFNLNLRTIHDSIFPVITDPTGITVTCIITAGTTVGSNDVTVPAFDIDNTWVASLDIVLQVLGRIQGKGGDGGQRTVPSVTAESDGEDGGTALYSRYDFELDNQGEIYGGGGGGAARSAVISGSGQGPGGGGGAGSIPGLGGVSFDGGPGQDGTTELGGNGAVTAFHSGGDGGDPGQPGDSASSFSGTPGAAGNAIDGVSYATITTAGTRAGPEIN